MDDRELRLRAMQAALNHFPLAGRGDVKKLADDIVAYVNEEPFPEHGTVLASGDGATRLGR